MGVILNILLTALGCSVMTGISFHSLTVNLSVLMRDEIIIATVRVKLRLVKKRLSQIPQLNK